MAQMMGVANMGGPAVGVLPEFPTSTVPPGATMPEAMKGMRHGAMDHAGPATDHDSTTARPAIRILACHGLLCPSSSCGVPSC